MNSIAEESFSNIRTVRGFANEADEIRKFREANQIVFKVGKKKAGVQAVTQLISQIILMAGIGTVLYVGSILVQEKKVSIGIFTGYLFYMTAHTF